MNLQKSKKSTSMRVLKILLFSILICSSGIIKAQNQTITVKGTIKDKDNEPIIGATVIIEGSTIGTITDMDGKYVLSNTPSNGVLIFSFIGFKTQKITIAGKDQINVILKAETVGIDEVIAVGYGTQKKGDITSSIAVMDADKLTERPVNKVDQALVGQMAGVHVKQTSGLPGKGFDIQIRGSGTINANNQPLYVVDGFPLEASAQSTSGSFSTGNPLANISPNDIETIQVLKDAAAASIYGSRGANGVVLITTKKGKTGKPKISFNTYVGWNEVQKKLDVLSSKEWVERAIEHENYNWVNSSYGGSSSDTNAERRTALGLDDDSYNTSYMWDERWLQDGHPGLDYVDWQDLFFRKGMMQSYQISATGGTETTKYYVAGDVLNQEGVAIGVNYKRYSARANVEVTPNNKVKFGVNISPSYSDQQDPGVEGKDGLTHVCVGEAPVVESSCGAEGTNVGDNSYYAWGPSRVSPIAVAENVDTKNETFRAITTSFLEIGLLKGLKFKTDVNFDYQDNEYYKYTPSYVTKGRAASAVKSGYTRKNFVTESTFHYNQSFGKHNLDALAGYSYSTFKYDYEKITGSGFASDEVITINAATTTTGTTTQSKNVLISYFSRLQYSYNNKYFSQFSVRRDGSSKFGDNTKWGYFPSGSLGWKVSEEDFMSSLDYLSNLKLRLSWGLAGNNGVDDYESIPSVENANYSYSGSSVNGVVPSNYANADLSWETSETTDIGVDLGFFANRITSAFDYYRKKTTDLLLDIPVPAVTGYTTALTNIGEVLNKGWELEINSRNLIGAFKWQTQINVSHNANVVKKLGPDNADILGGSFDITHNICTIGKPMYTLYLVQQDGLLTTEDVNNGVAMYGDEEAGDPKYVDQNGDGTIDSDDRTFSGHPDPDITWGITNTFSYKGFDLNILTQGQWGGKIYSTFGRAMYRTGMGASENTLGKSRNRVRWVEGQTLTEADVKGKERKSPSSFGRIKNTDWLYPNDYWRIRTITLGYDLKRIISNEMVSSARLYVSAENWFGGDKYNGGFNPEAKNNGGDDYGAFPLSKSMVLGLNITF